jgi:hypothetical protein
LTFLTSQHDAAAVACVRPSTTGAADAGEGTDTAASPAATTVAARRARRLVVRGRRTDERT